MEKMVKLEIRVAGDVKKALQKKARKQKCSVAEIVRLAIAGRM